MVAQRGGPFLHPQLEAGVHRGQGALLSLQEQGEDDKAGPGR